MLSGLKADVQVVRVKLTAAEESAGRAHHRLKAAVDRAEATLGASIEGLERKQARAPHPS